MSYGSDKALGIMFQLIDEITLMGLPVVFVGGMVLRRLSASLNMPLEARMTRDIDMNWFQKDVTNEDLYAAICTALNRIGWGHLEVVLRRTFTETRGAGIDVKFPGEKSAFFSLDITVKDSPKGSESFFVQYPTASGALFRGSAPSKMLADKVSVASTPKIMRRVKDLFDLAVLSQVSGYNTHEVLSTIKKSGNTLGDFATFRTKIETTSGIRHAYDKLVIEGHKPSFDHIYPVVSHFCEPFIRGIDLKVPLIWRINSEGRGFWVNA